ncbi:MAG: DUF4956 domain-containing protein [Salinivirgaceae bacterium]|jgi:hypothetical protein|nr:DUF4956 domain-containing protein [Salinivirgaceae bacterium]
MMLNEIMSNILSMPFWEGNDYVGFLIRLLLHIFVLVVIVRLLYYRKAQRRDYLFTYFLISVVIFLLSYMLENVKLQLGMALGLFAVFGIIRYRTSQIPIKEMTYLFIVIGLAVINALVNKKSSMAELVTANAVIIGLTWSLECLWRIPHASSKIVQYDNIDLITPQRRAELIADLQERLGLDIFRVEVGKVDFLRDSAKLVVHYRTLDRQNTNMADDIESYSLNDDDD